MSNYVNPIFLNLVINCYYFIIYITAVVIIVLFWGWIYMWYTERVT